MKRGGKPAWIKAQMALSRRAKLPIVGLGLLAVVATVVQAWCLARLVGPVLVGRAIPDVWRWAGLFALAAVARSGLAVMIDGLAFEAGVSARRRLRTAYLVAAFRQGPNQRRSTGEAVAAAVDQVEGLDGFFSRWMSTATLAWAAPVLVVAAMASADPVAAGITALGGFAVPFGMALAGIGAAVASHRQFEAMARLQARFLDRVQGIATLVLAGQAEAEATRLEAAAKELAQRTMRVLRAAFLSSAVLDTAAVIVLVVLAVRAGVAWRAGALHPVSAVFSLVLVSEFFSPLRAYAAAYQDRVHAVTAAKTLGAMDGAGSEQAGGAPALPAVRTVAATGVSVGFEGVRFAWDVSRGAVLDGLSFRVPANEVAVLVGPSGVGKSTVMELLLGFVQPQAGRITINGADLASLTPAALSRITAWIGQRPMLFAGSIRENIRFGNLDASEAAVDAAAASAGLAAVAAALPDGLDTVIGEGGYGLSGGQAQRVAIARAFVRNAPLLLMDEPTAHLDPATEADVLDSLRRLASGRTVILASHSNAAMAFGGRRIVLEGGRARAVAGAA